MRIYIPVLLLVVGACVADAGDPGPDLQEPGGGKGDTFGDGGERSWCDWDWECSDDSGLICRPSTGEGPKALRCLPPSKEQGFCEDNDDCEGTSLVCRPTSVNGKLRCMRPAAANELCGVDEDCADSSHVCRPDGIEEIRPVLRCQPLGLETNACADEDDCASGLACEGAYRIDDNLLDAGACTPT